ncbi:hypothetical protein F4821DRAFT_271252 [Hypoxylon rubiginosum]|uniref:Uncharacterized protein n=1 Tax=Hypoxylon rubiginosum TaxID=110542 RepID=A0ACC0CV58_9PEZI|nr:hypothetical protein F4821DRAFT_271252 [Hypoxylon rubiginosum]
MDPASAFGLAAGVVQFVSFASGLLSRSREIHNSAKGCTDQTETLDAVYQRLVRFSSDLQKSSCKDQRLLAVEPRSAFVQHILAINDLAGVCEADCTKILACLQKLKGSSQSITRWQSFRLALKTIWKGREITEMEQRLHHTQTTLTLHICGLISSSQSVLQQQLDGLRAESNKLELQGFSKLDKMEKQLLTLVHRLDQHFTPDDMAVLQSQVSELSMSQRDTAKEYAVIRSLGFDSRDARHAAIREAHRKTFDWALSEARAAESQGVCSSGGGLARWLRSGSGTFWVSGKPGSGKSTLMKRITGHPTTKQLLSVWAHPERIVLISHYFWSAGTAMQKSQHGLLQTLLYDIFRQLPDLIESVCAERLTRPLEELDRQAWTVPELWGVLQRIAEQASLRVKFCLFIDGLDEYDGDLVDFCRALRKLSTSPHFKICVSSRPWNVFEDSFGLDPACKMYVQDFTRPDIRLFVESRLKEHPRWEEVSAEVGNADSIIGEITERAAGVFLWVFLVTKQLRDGLTEYDGFSDIRRRLDSIPNDLEVFFRQMLDSVEPFYHEKMATTLQIALAAKYPAPILVYSFHDDEYEDPNYALKLPLQPLEPRAAASRREQTSRHLSGRCRGLLEVNRSTKYVEFMHRTVMDYLRTRDISDYLEAKAPSYDPDLALLKAFTAFIKSTAFPEFVDRTEFAKYTPSELMSTVQEALAHAALLESNATVFRILEELDYVIPAMHYSGQAKLNIWGDPSNPVCLFFRECAVKADLNNYFRYILPKIPDYFAPFSPDAMQRVDASVLELFHAQRPCRIEPPPRASCSHAEGDINPASQDPTKQAWVDFLQRTLPSSPDAAIASTSQLGWLLESGSIPIMLRQGADPNARLSQRQPVNSSMRGPTCERPYVLRLRLAQRAGRHSAWA